MSADDEFAELYRTQRVGLFRLAYLVCRDKQRAEEAVAEGVARVLPRWRAGRVEDPALYLRRAVVNQAIGAWRRRVVEQRHAQWDHDRDTSSGVEEEVGDRDMVWRALGALPPKQRAAIALRFYDDLSVDRAAAVLGVSVGTIKSRVARGLERLRELLVEEHRDA
jgi:RNA polymerase sigma-70 factor (sigma-E family)